MIYLFAFGVIGLLGLLAGISLVERHEEAKKLKAPFVYGKYSPFFELNLPKYLKPDLHTALALIIIKTELSDEEIYKTCQILHELEYRETLEMGDLI